MKRIIFSILGILVLGIACSRKLPELLSPEGMPQNVDTAREVYTTDGTKLDFVLYDGTVYNYGPNGTGYAYNYAYDNDQKIAYASLNVESTGEYLGLYCALINSSPIGSWVFYGLIIKPTINVPGYWDYIDLSSYSKLVFDIKADSVISALKIVFKDKDNVGTDQTINNISTDWKTYSINLSSFANDESKAYLLFGIALDNVNSGPGEHNVYIKNIGFVK